MLADFFHNQEDFKQKKTSNKTKSSLVYKEGNLSGSQSVIQLSAASATPGNLLEVQVYMFSTSATE